MVGVRIVVSCVGLISVDTIKHDDSLSAQAHKSVLYRTGLFESKRYAAESNADSVKPSTAHMLDRWKAAEPNTAETQG